MCTYINDEQMCDMLNSNITDEEIINVINTLKPNKACGPDGIFNEMIYNSSHKLLPIFVQLFSFIFNTPTTINSWQQSLISPILKKGNSLKFSPL